MSRASTRRDLRGFATIKVSVGPSARSTNATIETTCRAPVRYQPGQRYQPRYWRPKISVSRVRLAQRCRPHALSRNLILSGAAAQRERHVGLGLCRAGRESVPGEKADIAAVVAAADLRIQARRGGQRRGQPPPAVVPLRSKI